MLSSDAFTLICSPLFSKQRFLYFLLWNSNYWLKSFKSPLGLGWVFSHSKEETAKRNRFHAERIGVDWCKVNSLELVGKHKREIFFKSFSPFPLSLPPWFLMDSWWHPGRSFPAPSLTLFLCSVGSLTLLLPDPQREILALQGDPGPLPGWYFGDLQCPNLQIYSVHQGDVMLHLTWLLLMQNNSWGISFFLSGDSRELVFLCAAPFCLDSFSFLPHYMRQ